MAQDSIVGLWLELSKLRLESDTVKVQVIGDREDEPCWLVLGDTTIVSEKSEGAPKIYERLSRGLESNEQTVLVRVVCAGSAESSPHVLKVDLYRIQTK